MIVSGATYTVTVGSGTWYQHDGVGSIRAVLDGAGAVQSTTSYDPWGVPTAGSTDPFGFTGELHDGDLVHLRARWYNPSIGTFTARDPFAGFDTQPYSLHPYQYAYSNPVLLTDPSGQVAACGAGAFLPGPGWVAAALCVGVHLLAPIAAGGLGLWLLNDTAQSMQQESSPAQTQPAADPATVAAPAPRLQSAPRPIPAAPPAPPTGGPRPVEPAIPPLAPPAPPAVPRADPDCDVDADADVNIDTDVRFGQPTPTPESKKVYVADSNLFQDRMDAAIRDTLQRDYFDDPNISFILIQSAYDEINVNQLWKPVFAPGVSVTTLLKDGTQVQGGITLVADPDISNLAVTFSRNFDQTDAQIVETARTLSLPVLTPNTRLRTQVTSDPRLGRERWRYVTIEHP